MKKYRLFISLVFMFLLVGCSDIVSEEEITKAIEDKVEVELNKAIDKTVDRVTEEGKQTAEEILEEGTTKLNDWLGGISEDSPATNESKDVIQTDGTIEQYKMEYISNYDADTLKVRFLEGPNKGQTVSTRLLLVDAPEIKDKTTGMPQPYSVEGRDRAEELLNNAQTITATYDVGERIDKYDRSLLYLFLDGKLLQTSLAEEGMVMVRYINAPNTRHLDEIKAAEQLAKQKGKGIWSLENYDTNKGYRP